MARTYRFKPTEKQLKDKKNRFVKSKTTERIKVKQSIKEIAYSY